MKGRITKTGYRRNSPDVNNDFNIIPSNRISMQGVDFPVFGVDNMGNSQMMYPGGEYEFQGDYVTELPAYGSGGLTQWFAEKWVDIKTGKKCGRSGKDKKGRPYPACRPSKRVNSTTPKTSSEMSASEKAKFKRKKKSGKRIDYNHKRELGGALDMYQTKGEVNFQSLDPRLQGNNIDATYVNTGVINDQYILNRSEAERLRDENPQGSITTYEEPSAISKGLNRAAHPFATMSYVVNNQRLPDRVGDGFGGRAASMDFAASFVNPADVVYYGIEGVKDIAKGNYATGALNVLGAVPAIPSAAVTRRVAKEVVTSPTGKLYRTTLIDPFRPRYLDKQVSTKRGLVRDLKDKQSDIDNYYGRLEQEAIDSKNVRSGKFMEFRDNNREVFNAYNDRRITQLTPFKTKDAYNKRSVLFSERGIDNQFLQQVSKNFDPDISVRGLKPKSLESPLFQDLNTQSSLTDLQTGLTRDFTISPPQSGGQGFKFDNNLNKVIPNRYQAISSVGVPAEARNIVSNNISTLESSIPGFKVMGSSKGFADVGFPSFPKDYDGIMTQGAYNKYVKKKYDLIDGSGVANVHRVKINNTPLDIDFNIIQQNSKGIAEGRLAEQLFRKADPDNYFRQSEAVVSGKQKRIRIPYTPEELISKTDFTKQSIADAFEIPSSKAKHISRPDVYLSYGDADKVLDAQKSYAQSMIGSKAYLPPQYSPSEFADIAKNKRLLGDMEFAGDINTVAQDPTKMQAVLNDFYFSNTTLSRGIDINSLKKKATPRQALTEWNPAAGGGSYAGAGLNNTLLGETGYGNVYGQKQFKLNLNNSTPSDLVSEVRKLSLETNLDPSQMKAANDVLIKYGLANSYNSPVQTKGDFLQKIVPAGPDALKDYYKATGSPFISGNPYGESIYAGSANVFNPSQDLLAMGFKNPNLSGSIPVGKSWMARSRNTADNPNFYFEDKLMNLNSDEYSLLYNRFNTPVVDGMREGIDKAIRRSLNQPGDYTDQLLNAMELRGGLSPNQKIQQGIKTREIENLRTNLENEISSLDRRINTADRLRGPLVYGTMGTVITGAAINKSMNDRDDWRAAVREEERQKDLQIRKENNIPEDAVAMSSKYFEKFSDEKLKERFGKVTPMYVGDQVYLIPSKQKGGEKSIREKSNEKFGKSNAFSEYISNPTRIAVIEGVERLDDTPRSNTGVGDDVTSSLINKAIYGNPLTVAPKLEALQKTKDWTFENIRPVQYPSIFNYMMSAGNAVAGKLGLTEGNAPPARDSEGDLMIDEEMYAKVMGVPHKSKYISESKYKPSQAKDSDAKYYTVDWDSMIDKEKLIDYAVENKLMKGENMVVNSLAPFLKEGYMPEEEFKNIDPLQNFTIGLGEDDKGRYLSIYDKYDFNKTFNTVTSPFEIYDRFYLYESGGEQLPDYSVYDTFNRAWLAARKKLGRGKQFMYGGKVRSTDT